MEKREGFTLLELLMVVIILAVLISIGVPQYTKSIERARATEAMAMIKTINDAIYAHAAGRDQDYKCSDITFDKLIVSLPVSTSAALNKRVQTTEYFKYVIPQYVSGSGITNTVIPGTRCTGAFAQRINGGKYDYVIWNPYKVGRDKKLACYSPGEKKDSNSLCKSLGMNESRLSSSVLTSF